MNVFLIVVGILAIIAGIVGPIIVNTVRNDRRRYNETVKPVKKTAWMALILVGILMFIFGNAFVIIPTGYTGVRVTFGQINEVPAPNGLNFKTPFVEKIVAVNNKQQDKTFSSEVWGETIEKTPVYATDVVVSYMVMAEKSAWLYQHVTDVDNLVDAKLVASAVKAAMVELSVENVTNRSHIEPLVLKKLNVSLTEKYGENAVVAVKVIINNMDFEASYNEAIAAKSIAAQNQQRIEIENQTAIKKAEADKQVALMNAEAAAEAKKIEAEAAAQALLIQAEAEAEANRKLAESLTDEVIQNKTIEKWDGKLPTVTGDGGAIIDIRGTNVTP